MAAVGGTVRTRIRKILLLDQGKEYLLVNIDNITELTQTRHEAFLYHMMTEVDTALALTKADGTLLKYSSDCQKLLQLEPGNSVNLADYLDDEGDAQWQRITEQLYTHGYWRGQLNCGHRTAATTLLHANFKAIVNHEGELDYIACQFIEYQTQSESSDNMVPHRSTVLVNYANLQRYFNALPTHSRNAASLILLDVTPRKNTQSHE